jgi:hypothetical protein
VSRARKPYRSAAATRKAHLDRCGIALIAACALIFAGMLYGAYKLDQARGISIGQSLRSAGL